MSKLTFLLVFTTIFKIVFSQRDFRFVFSIFRHGARAPQEGVVNGVDLLNNSWKSPGELTEVGMRMHFLLGRRNRQRYGNFISTTYSPKEIFVRSSDYNRTIMSVNSQLQGLFTPPVGPVLNSFQVSYAFPTMYKDFGGFNTSQPAALPNQMQVFPVHLMSEIEIQYFFFFGFKPCSPLLNVLAANSNNQAITSYISTFKSQYGSQLAQAYPKLNITSYHQLFVFFDTFISGYAQGYTFPELTNLNVDLVALNKTAYDFSTLDILLYYNGDTNHYLPTITFSAFWVDLKNWIQTRINNDLSGDVSFNGFSTPKMVLYSTHDVTLGSVMTIFKLALGWNTIYYTPYASSLNIEVTRPSLVTASIKETDYQISINYNDNIYGPYTVSDFISKLDAYYWNQDDVAVYCSGLPWLLGFAVRRATIGLGVLFVFFFLSFVITLVICCCCYKRKEGGDQPVAVHQENEENNKV